MQVGHMMVSKLLNHPHEIRLDHLPTPLEEEPREAVRPGALSPGICLMA
jgi:hypothetical protein